MRDIFGFKSADRGERQDEEGNFYSQLSGFFVIVSLLNDSLNKSEEFINQVHERCSAFYQTAKCLKLKTRIDGYKEMFETQKNLGDVETEVQNKLSFLMSIKKKRVGDTLTKRQRT
jgi:hypothetical protein